MRFSGRKAFLDPKTFDPGNMSDRTKLFEFVGDLPLGMSATLESPVSEMRRFLRAHRTYEPATSQEKIDLCALERDLVEVILHQNADVAAQHIEAARISLLRRVSYPYAKPGAVKKPKPADPVSKTAWQRLVGTDTFDD